jgi:type VI secretion system secreted protein VgrG
MNNISQKNRPIGLKVTSLGNDDLLLNNFTINEGLSILFCITAEVIAQKEINLEKILGSTATIRWNTSSKAKRYFNGHVTEILQLTEAIKSSVYRITIRPWINFLSYTGDCQIFQDMTTPNIIKKVFKDVFKAGKFKESLKRTYPKKPFCIQYNESSLNFVLRLMESEGIYYYFEHEDGKHTLVLSDDKSNHKSFSGYNKIPYKKLTRPDNQCIGKFARKVSFATSSFSTNGYDYTKPTEKFLAVQKAQSSFKPGCEIYQNDSFPVFNGKGKDYAAIGMERLQSNSDIYIGQSNAGGIAAGHEFKLSDFTIDSKLNKSYLVINTHIDIKSQFDKYKYSIDFAAIDSKVQYRPQITATKPNMAPQTATVTEVGKGENLGMVQVKFHWDRSGSKSNTSAWLRVAQAYAGKKWGSFFIPGKDQEVIIIFLNGNPDQPLVSLALYNGDNELPVDFKDAEKHSGIVSQDLCSKLYFEDDPEDKTKAKINIFTEGDMDTLVTGITTELYTKSLSTDIGEDGLKLTVKGDTTNTFEKNITSSCKGEEVSTIEKDSTLTVKGARTEKITKDLKLTVNGNKEVKVTKNYKLQAMKIDNKGTQGIKSTAGQSSQELAVAGVTVKGMQISNEATAQLTCKGALATVEATGMLTLKGTLTKIN